MREPNDAMMDAARAAAYESVPVLDTGFDHVDTVIKAAYRAAIDVALQE